MEVLDLKRLVSVDEFDMSEFYQGFIELVKKVDLTEEEQVVLQYFKCCEKRHAPEEVIMIDKEYKKVYL